MTTTETKTNINDSGEFVVTKTFVFSLEEMDNEYQRALSQKNNIKNYMKQFEKIILTPEQKKIIECIKLNEKIMWQKQNEQNTEHMKKSAKMDMENTDKVIKDIKASMQEFKEKFPEKYKTYTESKENPKKKEAETCQKEK